MSAESLPATSPAAPRASGMTVRFTSFPAVFELRLWDQKKGKSDSENRSFGSR